MASEKLVLAEVKDRIATVTLNRPRALNALNTEMIEELQRLYVGWTSGMEVAAVVLTSSGGKALCAGGDVKGVVQGVVRGEGPGPGMHFFTLEYRVDNLIANYPVPHVAIMDGICFGGGVGLSVHGAFQISTERSLFAMPECAIGLYPDVGGSYFLPRLAGGLGRYLGVTGARLHGSDLARAGIASHYIPSARLPALLEGIHALGGRAASHDAVRGLLDRFQAEAPLPDASSDPRLTLAADVPYIDAVFGPSSATVEDAHRKLAAALASADEHEADWARRTSKAIAEGSPLSQKLTWEQIRRGAALDRASCFIMEHGMMTHMLGDRESDFVAGVTAKLITRSKEPTVWRHAKVDDVTDAEVQAFFAPLSVEKILRLPSSPARL